jgi:hypothetical protein
MEKKPPIQSYIKSEGRDADIRQIQIKHNLIPSYYQP